MATCANCIHHSLCDYNTNVSGNGKIRLVYAEGADVKCSFFQNTADVVPKSEVVEMQKEQLGRLKEIKSEVERVTVEYEAMRGAANSYKMHYEQAKTEVERLQAEVDQLHALLECGVFANSVEDWQKFLNEKRAEVAMEIFEEIEKLTPKKFTEKSQDFEFGYALAIQQIKNKIAELKKKYTGEKECPNCRYFVGCECFDGKTCDEYEEKKE